MKPYQLKVRKNTCDSEIIHCVVEMNEYKLEKLDNQNVAVDIGAHIGSFAFIAAKMGVKRIFCFEPNIENFQMLLQNIDIIQGLYPLTKITAFNSAVWRSDKTDILIQGEYPKNTFNNELNTGGVSVFDSVGNKVDSISLNTVLDIVGEDIDILKMDCEGSEWPILYTFDKFDRIKSIVGEYHEIQNPKEFIKVKDYKYIMSELEIYLVNNGFRVEHFLCSENIGKFFAKKEK